MGGDDPLRANEIADDVLAGAEYQEPQPSLVERVLDWIGEQLGRAFENTAGFDGGQVSGLVFVVLAVALVAFLLWRALRAPRSPRARRRPTVLYGTDVQVDADRWRDEARRLVAEGDHRGAVRCWFQAVASELVERGISGTEPGRTAAEIGADASVRLPGVADEVDELVERFEVAWYGGGSVDAGDATAAGRLAETVSRAASTWTAEELEVPT